MGAAAVPLRLLRKLRRLGARATLDVLVAQTALIRARRALRRRPSGELLAAATSRPAKEGGDMPRSTRVRLERMAVAVRRAADYGLFRPTCLVRALALEELAHRVGASNAVVRVGVRRPEGGFEAHAWLEVDGRVVGDTEAHVAGFTVLDDFSGLRA